MVQHVPPQALKVHHVQPPLKVAAVPHGGHVSAQDDTPALPHLGPLGYVALGRAVHRPAVRVQYRHVQRETRANGGRAAARALVGVANQVRGVTRAECEVVSALARGSRGERLLLTFAPVKFCFLYEVGSVQAALAGVAPVAALAAHVQPVRLRIIQNGNHRRPEIRVQIVELRRAPLHTAGGGGGSFGSLRKMATMLRRKSATQPSESLSSLEMFTAPAMPRRKSAPGTTSAAKNMGVPSITLILSSQKMTPSETKPPTNPSTARKRPT